MTITQYIRRIINGEYDLERPFAAEREQAIIRVIIAVIVIIYMFMLRQDEETNYYARLLSTIYLCNVIVIYFIILNLKKHNVLWRYLTLIIDILIVSIALYVIPNAALPLMFVYLWASISYGFRYGSNALIVSALLCITGLVPVILLSPYWSEYKTVGYTFLLAMIVLPSYEWLLTHRLLNTQKELTTALEQAEMANVAKTAFLANISHEVRTPLNGILAITELLNDSALPTQRGHLKTLSESGKTLLNLITNVLDYSKLVSNAVVINNDCVDLRRCVESAFRMLKPIAEQKGLRYELELNDQLPVYVHTDALKITQVLLNLLGNAIKYTTKGRIKVVIDAIAVNSKTTMISINVHDTGIGIAQNMIDIIFERFVALNDETARPNASSGLGLAIVRELVLLLNGVIKVSSVAGVGSDFNVTLPIRIISNHEYKILNNSCVIVGCEPVRPHMLQLMHDWNVSAVGADSLAALTSILELNSSLHYKILFCDVTLLKESRNVSTPYHMLLKKCQELRICIVCVGESIDKLTPYSLATPIDRNELYSLLRTQEIIRYTDDLVPVTRRHHRVKSPDQSLRILVADDVPTNQYVFREILQGEGHEVVAVENGQQALARLATSQYDLALLDLHMKPISGIDVIQAHRRQQTGRRVFYIIVTADTNSVTLQECKTHSDAVLTKPVSRDGLRQVIHAVMNGLQVPTEYIAEINNNNNKINSMLDCDRLDYLLKNAYDIQFYKELFAVFTHDARSSLDRLLALCNQPSIDSARIFDFAHAIKGICGDVLASELRNGAAELERYAQETPLDSHKIRNMVNNIEQVFQKTRITIQEYIAKQEDCSF